MGESSNMNAIGRKELEGMVTEVLGRLSVRCAREKSGSCQLGVYTRMDDGN